MAAVRARSSPCESRAFVGARAWANDLMQNARFPDKRLAERARQIAAAFAAKPCDSIPQSCSTWGPTKAAYRFFANPRVTCEDIKAPIAQAAGRACAGHSLVLAIQDTTALTFPKTRTMEELGALNSFTKGMLLHSTLALSAEGVPLGLLDLQWWTRDPGAKARHRRSRRVEDKESCKWLHGMKAAREAFWSQRCCIEGGRLIHVFDREGDIHEVFENVRPEEGAVIRCAQDRRVRDSEGRLGLAKQMIRSAPLLGTVRVDVPRSAGRPARFDVAVQLRSCLLRLDPDKNKHSRRRPLDLTLIELRESDPPAGVEPLHWLLWSTEPAQTLEEALGVVAIYRLRWRIEDYHVVFKGGCRVEQLQFESAERAAKALYLYAAVAVRILALREFSRREPEAPCTRVLHEHEWRALWTYIHQEPPSAQTPPPNMRQAVLWIGRLGGHLGRKGDGMPGVTTLWRGWRDLENLVVMYCATTA